MKKTVFYILILAILSSCNDVINNQPEAVLPIPSQEQ
ncbi:MAG: membrane lipoprotein lipid attachment site-containing protein, partial [Bacteroidales bacterium]|nr:membrane lipoprotein lipid attachment site-containing protein [Bacteroidales bacterium]